MSGDPLRIEEVAYGSAAWRAAVDLREAVLRRPLGRTWEPTAFDGEPQSWHLVAWAGDLLVGCLVLRPREAGRLQMRQVAVAPEWQRRGVGRALLAAAEQVARREGCRELTAHARATALPFYERAGYTVEGAEFSEIGLPHRLVRRRLLPTALRELTVADLPAVLELWRGTPGVGLNESDEPAALAAFLERNAGLSRVAERDGELVGAVLCGHDGRRGYLHHLTVAAAHRGQGLGRALVEACLADLAARGIPKCNLFLYADNAAGAAFWQALGFNRRADLHLLQTSTSRTSGP
ncbi:MAG: GNAT family N-acetyltransferase [Fimbriimonadaceae bacterium]|nr:GNAT family N-acetyltransferase [Fimbriimonadaceae bacterium]